MRSLKLMIPAAIVLTGFFVCTSTSYGTAEYTKKEKKSCTTCHAKQSPDKAEMNKNLTETGTCYKENGHSLEKCAPKK